MTAFEPIPFLETAVETPSHDDPGPMRSLLCETLGNHGVEPTVDPAGNVVATRPANGEGGPKREPHVVLNTHLDTVSPHVRAARDGDVFAGRGTCDAKGPLAAMLGAFLDCDLDGGRLTLAVTPDEEIHSMGAAALVPSLDLDAERGDAVVVGEPTGVDVCTAAKGRFEGCITVTGESAHAAEPATGTNAVALAAQVVEALSGFDDRSGAVPDHPDLGTPTLAPTVIEGGEATNRLAGACEIVIDRRSVPPETAAGFETALDTYLDGTPAIGGVEFRLTERETPFLEAFETSADTRIVRTLRNAGSGAIRPFTAATEASYFASEVPTVVFGPGELADETGPVAHADREYVRLSRVERAMETLDTALVDFFRNADG